MMRERRQVEGKVQASTLPHPQEEYVIFLRYSLLLKNKGKGFKCLPWVKWKTKSNEKLNSLTAYSPLTSPWNGQSDLPLEVQLPQ